MGYYISSSGIGGDNIKEELCRIRNNGKTSWCEVFSFSFIMTFFHYRHLHQDKSLTYSHTGSVAKAERVEEIAIELIGIHKGKCNKIQHKSKSSPHLEQKAKGTKVKDSAVDTMASAFTKLADSTASAFSQLTVKSQEHDRPDQQ